MSGYPGQYGHQGQYPQQGQYPPQQGYPQQGQYPPQQGYQQYPPQQQYQGGQYQTHQVGGWGQQFATGLSPQDMASLQAWFASVDTDRSGAIAVHELAQLTFNGKAIGQTLASKLIKIFDKSQNGTIDFSEYVALHQYLTKMQHLFYAADGDRSGRLDAQEIHGALRSTGFQLSIQTVSAICRKFDNTGAGLTFDQFLECCAHLAIVRSIFEWNDKNRSGTVTFNYDQLVDRVFIGSSAAAQDSAWLQENNIQKILCVCEKKANVPADLEQIHSQLLLDEKPLEDRLFDNELTPEDFWKYMSEASDTIMEAVDEEQNILVYCAEGVNRSVACGVAYLILYEDKSVQEAVQMANCANSERTRAFLKSADLELPEDQITFPTLTNEDFATALKYLKGAFEEGALNEETLRYHEQWEASYLSSNAIEVVG